MMDSIALREFLQKKYENPEAFLENVIFPVFGEDNYDTSGNYHWLRRHPEDQLAADNAGILDILVLGSIYVEGSQLDIFDVTVASKRQLANNRVGIQQLIRRIISTHSGAFIIFHYKTSERWDWRFTFCHKGASQLDSSDAKRYTFLLGPGQSCRTAADNFFKLRETISSTGSFTMDDVIRAFDVEALSMEFFGKYKAQYEKFVAYMADERNGMREDFIDTDFDHDGLSNEDIRSREEKPLRDYVKKLLGRIVFLYFIQKKGWLGVEPDRDWGDGDIDFMLHLFKKASDKQKSNFLDAVLEPLFEAGLNTDRSKDNYLFDTGIKGLPNRGILKVPYLNGGLFERDASDEPKSIFPAEYFDSLLTFLSQYNFTIDENDPNDAQVGIDPEMLGRIFENLLEDNKDKGTFYTPKEIVQYMCRESLVAYLQKDMNEEEQRLIRDFVSSYDTAPLSYNLKMDIDQKLKDVKVCDPAIGSGAFPMGILKEIFYCRGAIENFASAAKIKKEIINNNLYGVDIEKGAVDIARLRFWLAIVVDETNPTALPNLDYKVMQGNSLLELYKRVDLSHLLDDTGASDNMDGGLFGNEDIIEDTREELRQYRESYFNCPNHEEKAVIKEDISTAIKVQLSGRNINIDFEDLDIAGNQEFFMWHTWFSEVFDNGGFDIVIGNPPYINVQLMSDEEKQLYRRTYTSFFKRCDMFCLFLELGLLKLSAPKGIVTLIIPSVVHSNMSYQKIRDIVLNNHWLQEVHYTGGDVFNAPTVDTTILICNKCGNDYITLTNAVDFANPKSHRVTANYFETYNNVISVGDDQGSGVFDKLFNPNFDTVDQHYNVFQGIVTGNNPAFIFDTEDEALSKGVDISLLHPLCHGRDLEKYKVRSRERRILYIDNDVNINDYPQTKQWLLQFKEALDKRNEGKHDVISWCSLHRPRVKSELDLKEKILVQNTRNEALKVRMVATLDNHSVYGSQGINFIIPKQRGDSLRYLLGILNSKLINYLFATKFLNLAIKAEYVKQIRIPFANDEQRRELESLVDQVLQGKQKGIATSSLESKIDLMVYHLYGLSYDEVTVVDPEVSITREAY